MNIVAKIGIAALAGLGIAAIDAHAQGPMDGPGGPGPVADLKPLSAEQVKTVVDGMLILKRSDLKVGTVTEADGDKYDVELVKPDGATAEHTMVDKRFARPAGALAGPGGMPGFGPMVGGPGSHGDHGKAMRCGDDDDRPGRHAGMFGGQRAKPLTAAQVKDILEGRIAWRGEDLKVGKVAEKDAGTWRAEIVGADGKVVRTILVDKNSGRFMPERS